ncbi:MAG: elongation factor G [Bacteroidetes bacterium]|nr:elongation factor G [Bacteroidota bacterium]
MSEIGSKAQIRNIGIMAHIDAGKTTTTERFLFYSGYIHKLGQVDEGTAFMDFMAQEKERGITIMSAVTPVEWKNHIINIIDTPGHVDFTAEVQRSLRVLDGAVAVFCAVGGVQPQTETVWNQADSYNIPRIAYVNKMDRVGADFYKVVNDIQEKFNVVPLIIELPVGKEDKFEGVIDLITMKSLLFDSESFGAEIIETDIPDEYSKIAEEYRERMLETVCEANDELLEKYLEGQTITNEEIKKTIRFGTLNRKFVPVLCGSSLRNMGIQPLIEAVIDYLPSPLDLQEVKGYDTKNEDVEITRKLNDSEAFSSLAFKIVTDPYVGKLTYIRIYSGVLKVGEVIYNPRTCKKEKILKILKMHANKRDEVQEASSGEIVAIPGLRFTTTGDTLCSVSQPILFEKITFAEPVINQAIEVKNLSEQEKLIDALQRLAEEDPTFIYKNDIESGQLIISGVGELHLEIIIDRLLREFGIAAKVGKPQVAYKETINTEIEHEGSFDRSGGKNMFGWVKIIIKPAPNKGIIIENDITDKKFPKEFIDAALEGIKEAVKIGPNGYPMTDIEIRLIDSKYEDESTDIAYKIAASVAVKEAMRISSSVLLEPIFMVDVISPDEYTGDIIADLNTRRGRIDGIERIGAMQLIKGKAPLSEMFGYVTQLRSLSQGRASYSMVFSHYEATKK